MGVYQDVLYREPRTGCRSGCKALLAHAHSLGYSDKGCFNPASVVPGGGPSIHTVGRAVDLWWGDRNHNDFDEFVSLLADHAEELGIQQILWDGDGWSYNRPYWHPLSAPTDMHRDHAHIELTIDAADTLTVEAIAQVLSPLTDEDDMTDDQIQKLADAIGDSVVSRYFGHTITLNDGNPYPMQSVDSYYHEELKRMRVALEAVIARLP